MRLRDSSSGYQIKRHQELLLKNVEDFANKIKTIIFNEIKNKKIAKPDFSEIKSAITKIIKEASNEFRNQFVEEVEDLVKKSTSDQIIKELDNKFNNLLKRLFVVIEQEFDAIG